MTDTGAAVFSVFCFFVLVLHCGRTSGRGAIAASFRVDGRSVRQAFAASVGVGGRIHTAEELAAELAEGNLLMHPWASAVSAQNKPLSYPFAPAPTLSRLAGGGPAGCFGIGPVGPLLAGAIVEASVSAGIVGFE